MEWLSSPHRFYCLTSKDPRFFQHNFRLHLSRISQYHPMKTFFEKSEKH